MTKDAETKTPIQTKTNDACMNDLVGCLKIEIERNGSFSDSLNDMARGYAAGRGVSFPEAKNTIKDAFFDQNQVSPKEYLDAVYDQKPRYARGASNGHAGNNQSYGGRSR